MELNNKLMKITKNQLRQIIKEEIGGVFNKGPSVPGKADSPTSADAFGHALAAASGQVFNPKGEARTIRGYIQEMEDSLEDAALQFQKETRTNKSNNNSKLMTKIALQKIVDMMAQNHNVSRQQIEAAAIAAIKKFNPPSPDPRYGTTIQVLEKYMDEANVS